MKDFLGELLGTFILTMFGCGSVAVAVLFGEYTSIFQIAIVWGLAVTLAIYVTRHLCPAHLNPAVSVSMVLGKRMPARKLPSYLLAQFIGALLAGIMVLVLFNPSIESYELAHGIERGTAASVDTARMFGEFYPNPGDALVSTVSMPLAIVAEAVGTFVLVLFIFCFTEDCNVGRPDSNIAPMFIGLTVSICITLIAPLTQAGFNPARDFGPRVVAWLAGWGDAAFPDSDGGFFWVYILGPIFGGAVATAFFVYVLEPIMKKNK